MLKILSDKVREHILSNIISYIILILFFSLGIIGGAYIYNCYDTGELGVLVEFFNDAEEAYKNSPGSNLDIFKLAFSSSFKTVFLIWILGFTVIGIPIVFFTIIKKGFVFGLISNFLITNYSDGIITAVIILIIDSLVLLPVIYLMATYSISLSRTLIGMILGKIRFRVNLKNYIIFYFALLICAVFVVVIYSLLEAYFTGNILKWFFNS